MSVMKAIMQALAAVLAAVLPALLVEEPFTLTGVVNIVVLTAGALTVYNTANLPGWPIAKLIASVITGISVVVISAVSDNSVSLAEWMQIVTALVGAIAVYAVPNSSGRHAA